MKNSIILLITSILLLSCNIKKNNTTFENSTKTIKVEFNLNADKTPFYQVFYNNKIVLDSSKLGLIREDANFYNNLKVKSISESIPVSDTYSMVQGKQKNIEYNANKYIVHLENETGNLMDIIFQLSDDGVAFRYHFPETSEENKKITEEKTTYNFNESTKAWLQPMSKAKTGWSETNPSYEENYMMDIPVNTASPIGEGWVYPALFHTNESWVLITEAGLHEKYCGTRLKYNDEMEALQVTFPQTEEIFPEGELNPESNLPWFTPWRIITIGNLNTITESTLGTDVADKAIEMDTSFIKSGLSSWSWVLLKDDFTTFETSIKFIDYASEMNWPYCLIDADWDTKIGYEKMEELTKYATSKNVKVLVWYNSSGSWNSTPYHPKSKLLTQEDRIHEFTKLNEIGVSGVKIDFFGGDGQSMIAYYHGILKDAASHKLLVNFHGATLPRGWQRTYPHLLTMEAIKGEEFITFVQENADTAPSHCTVLPFARNAFDPMDFTPMVLDVIPNITKRTTAGFDLALPVLFLSGIQHIAEIPEGMAKQPQYVIDYLKDIPTNWDAAKFIEGFPGKDVIMARRKGDTWHITGINGENMDKEFTIDLSFISKDGFIISENENGFVQNTITPDAKLLVKMKPYGGFVMKF
ncbi:glycoside hydrolase family 97 protein [Lutibacter flavus]|uniref:Glycosyl-hydrolase 97 C-terminal, oligomerisation n=1 Tax=Lutibacter flavus TaxID=691689 RepID=A0A238YHH1_9FLAO|nr:glycoside hydrolase family 97 protein [Lutibacter flavus]SNR70238.1 Glycosyl-hydrolase 97 C-terminal, oligomerisation [Lutibacter flavus]